MKERNYTIIKLWRALMLGMGGELMVCFLIIPVNKLRKKRKNIGIITW